MLYYILPPFIIIASAGVLIAFLFRKMENIPAGEILEPVSEQKTSGRIDVVKSVLSQFGLSVLERMMHRAKLLALKFHNASNELFHSIREKRKNRMMIEQEAKQKSPESDVDPVIEVVHSSDDDRPRVKEMVLPSSHSAYLESQPISNLSQKPKPKANDKLEEALIKRIAINPRDIEAYERLGDYYLERENHNDSLECFKQVLKLSPAHHRAKTRIRKLESLLK